VTVSAIDRAQFILPKDAKYIVVANMGGGETAYRLNTPGRPCIEGADGIVQRFRNGAEIATLAVDYGTTKRAIVAAIRTMHRFWGGIRS